MNKKLLILIISVFLVVVGFLSYQSKQNKPVKKKYQDFIETKILQDYPELKSDYDEAMADGVLTNREAKAIIDLANNIKETKN